MIKIISAILASIFYAVLVFFCGFAMGEIHTKEKCFLNYSFMSHGKHYECSVKEIE